MFQVWAYISITIHHPCLALAASCKLTAFQVTQRLRPFTLGQPLPLPPSDLLRSENDGRWCIKNGSQRGNDRSFPSPTSLPPKKKHFERQDLYQCALPSDRRQELVMASFIIRGPERALNMLLYFCNRLQHKDHQSICIFSMCHESWLNILRPVNVNLRCASTSGLKSQQYGQWGTWLGQAFASCPDLQGTVLSHHFEASQLMTVAKVGWKPCRF